MSNINQFPDAEHRNHIGNDYLEFSFHMENFIAHMTQLNTETYAKNECNVHKPSYTARFHTYYVLQALKIYHQINYPTESFHAHNTSQPVENKLLSSLQRQYSVVSIDISNGIRLNNGSLHSVVGLP